MAPPLFSRIDPRRNIRIRVALMFGAVALGFAAAGGYFHTSLQERALREAIGSSFQQLAYLFGTDLAKETRERHEDLRFVAALPAFVELGARSEEPPRNALRRKLLDALKESQPAFAWIGAVDTRGTVLAATDGLLEGKDVSARPWFAPGLAGPHFGSAHRAALLEPYLGGEPLRFIDIVTPVRDSGGTVVGAVAAHLYVEWANQTIARLRSRIAGSEDTEVLLATPDGTILFGPRAGQTLKIPAKESRGYSMGHLDGGAEAVYGFHRVAIPGDIPGFEWLVVVRSPADVALAPVRQMVNRSYLLAITLGLLFVGVGFLLAHRIARLEELQQRLARFEAIARSFPVGIAYFDRNQVVGFTNAKAAELLGWAEADVPGKTVEAIVGPAYPLVRPRLEKALAGEQVNYTREITSRGSGERHTVDVTIVPDRAAGEVRGAYILFHDVTEKARTEAELRRKSAQHESVLETMAEGVTMVDADGRYIVVNAATERIVGLPRSQILGRKREDNPWTLVAPDGKPIPAEEMPFKRLREGADRVEDFEFDVIGVDGRRTSLSLNAVALRDAEGNYQGVVNTLTDITSRRQAEERIRRSGRRMAATLESALDAIVTADHKGDIVGFNPAAEHTLGFARADIIGKPLADILVPPSHRARHREGWRRFLETGESTILGRRIEVTAMRADGTEIQVEIAIIRLPDEDPPVFTAFLRDITERKKAEERLRHAQERLDRAMGASAVALFEIDVATGRSYLSESWSTMLGGPAIATDTSIAELLELTHPDDRDAIWQVALDSIRGKRDGYEMEHRVRNLAGEWIWVLSRSRVVERDADGRALKMLGTNVDITDRKRAEQRIHYLATRDALTDLNNRALFGDRLANAMGEARHNGGQLALLAIGLDRFTTLNDSLGHEAGDLVLKRVAERITACANPRDTVARPGGDEYLVLIPRIESPTEVSHAAEAIRNAIAMPLAVARRERVVTASIGIALFPNDGDSAGELLRNAETALHHAKESGRNNAQFFTEGMNEAVRARLETEAELRLALERDEFELHFQPQVELATGALVGWEALLRWRHPEHGLVPPGRFIGTAEETGLIVPIGQCVLLKACRQAVAWNRTSAQPMRMAVNVTARQFRHPGFVRGVKDTLASTGLDARLLELEIIENALMGHGPEVAATLRGLGELGVELSIDDFGTGYSSLSYLKNLPIDSVKIDQSFVRDIPGGRESCAIVSAVIELAHGLGLKVVAEGVENSAQADFLRGLGCDLGQGYFFGRPEPPEHWAGDNAANVIKLRRA